MRGGAFDQLGFAFLAGEVQTSGERVPKVLRQGAALVQQCFFKAFFAKLAHEAVGVVFGGQEEKM